MAYGRTESFEIARVGGFDLVDKFGGLVLENSLSILHGTHHVGRGALVVVNKGLLDLLFDRALDSSHEARAHVYTVAAKRQCCCQLLAVADAARADEWDTQVSSCDGLEYKVSDVLTNYECK